MASRERVIPIRIDRSASPAVASNPNVHVPPSSNATQSYQPVQPSVAASSNTNIPILIDSSSIQNRSQPIGVQIQQKSPRTSSSERMQGQGVPNIQQPSIVSFPEVKSGSAVEQSNVNTAAEFSKPQLRLSFQNDLESEIGNKIIHMLDEIEKRVENLRDTASLMEQEKESLLEMLNTVQMNKDLLHISKNEKEDIELTTNRLLTRCSTVSVTVSTPRNLEQEHALKNVNSQIEALVAKMKEDAEASKDACKRFLNACNPNQPDGPIDQRFQAMVIECTADDQKKIRKRLEHMLQTIERTCKTISQVN